MKSVVIVGGGVAGIAAAVALAEAGLRVTLLEKRPLLGGRASSFLDKETGARLDECQHGTMRCCTNLTDLLERLGVHDQIRYHSVIPFLDSEGNRSVICGSGLPAPLHTALSFLRFRSLGLKDKIAIARGMMAMLRTKPDAALDSVDIGAWFRRMGQTERAVRRFWEPILVSACNEALERIACTHAFKIFRDGFLLHPKAYEFGVPRVPLGALYTEPTVAYLKQRGGCVRARAIAGDFLFEGEGAARRVRGVALPDGETLEADYTVSALQCDLLLKLLPPELVESESWFSRLKQIELAPIIGAHLWLDRAIDCPEALALLDRETDWIFNKTKNWDLPEGSGTYLSMVISASHHLMEMPKEEVLRLVTEEVQEALPETRQAKIVKSLLVRWPKATFAPKPGMEELRPEQRSPIANFFVAGEWTRTGWPSTMESAARSGYLAAEAVLADAGCPQRLLIPDLKPSGLARLLDGHRSPGVQSGP